MPATAAPPTVTYVHGLVRPSGARVPREWYVPERGLRVAGGGGAVRRADRLRRGVALAGRPLGRRRDAAGAAGDRRLRLQDHDPDAPSAVIAPCSGVVRPTTGSGWCAAASSSPSYDGFCRAHWQHHRHCGTEDDGEDSDYLTLQDASALQLLVHLVKPLLGVQAGRLALAALAALVASLRGRRTGARGRPGRRRQARPHVPIVSPAAQLVAIAGCQLAIALLASGFGRHPWLVLAYPATARDLRACSSAACARSASTSRLDRHVGECSVRSHLPNPVDRLFFYTLNMNLHVEHHLFPQVPACHLPAVRQQPPRRRGTCSRR